MTTFADVAGSYERGARLSVYSVPVACDSMAAISRALTRLRRLAVADDELTGLVALLRCAQYRLATNVLPANHPALGIADLAERFAHQFQELHEAAEARMLCNLAFDALSDLLAQPSTPLGDAAVSHLDAVPIDERVVVLERQRHVEETGKHLAALGLPSAVVSAGQVRSRPAAEVMVCVGPPNRFPAAIWNAGRADSVCFLHYPLGPHSAPSGGLFGEEGGLRTPRFRVPVEVPRVMEADLAPPDESLYLDVGRRIAKTKGGEDRAERAPAQLLLLEGGYAVWMSAGEGDWMWSIDVLDDQPRISQVSPSNMAAGHFVIFRNEGATSELIRELADRTCGAAPHRATQERWKDALRAAIARAGGAANAARLIQQRGGVSANPTAWIGRRSVRPHSKADVIAGCRFAGLGDEAEQVWDALTAIRSAHIRAGHLIRKQLELALLEDGLAELQTAGVTHLSVEGLGGISAYRVVFKHPDIEPVDVALIDRPFLAKESGWPEWSRQ